MGYLRSGIQLITEERENQYLKGRTTEEDAKYNSNEFPFHNPLIIAAHELLHENPLPERCPNGWNMEKWIGFCKKSHAERLTIVGALIAAQLDVMTYLGTNELVRKDPETKV